MARSAARPCQHPIALSSSNDLSFEVFDLLESWMTWFWHESLKDSAFRFRRWGWLQIPPVDRTKVNLAIRLSPTLRHANCEIGTQFEIQVH